MSRGSARGPLLSILFVNFMGTLGFGLVLPFLIFLVSDWGGNAVVYGIAGATYSAFQLVGAPVLGRWSDVVGRRRILLLSQGGTLLSWIIFLAAFFLPLAPLATVDSEILGRFALTLPLAVLLLARALDGLTGGNVSVANAYLADISPTEERTANFGKMAVSSNLGYILGPAIAGLLGATPWGEVGTVLCAVLISLLATLSIVFLLPESRTCILAASPERPNVRKVFGQEQRDCFELRAAPRLSAAILRSLGGVPTLLTIHFLVMLGFNFFYVTFPVYASGPLSWSLPDVGAFFTVLGLLMVLVEGPLLARVSRHVPETWLLVGGGVALAAGFLLFDSTSALVVYGGVALVALGNGVMWPSVLSLLSRAAGPTYQGAVQGLAGSLGAVASIVGLLAGGMLYAGIGTGVFWMAGATILLAAVIGLGSARERGSEGLRRG